MSNQYTCQDCGKPMKSQGIPAKVIDAETGQPTGMISYWLICQCGNREMIEVES